MDGNLDWVQSLPVLVSSNMNDRLTAPISDLEIKAVVDGMGATKAPGPDGVNGMFFQKNWEVVGREVCAAVHRFFLMLVSFQGRLMKQWWPLFLKFLSPSV